MGYFSKSSPLIARYVPHDYRRGMNYYGMLGILIAQPTTLVSKTCHTLHLQTNTQFIL